MTEHIGYIRVSTVEQNIERQLLNIELDKTFTDKCSGKDTNRPQLKLLIEYARQGDVIHVHDISRMARNTEDFDVLIYVANWPKPRVTAWDTLLKARAIENMSYCIGVNRIGTDPSGHHYTGHSAVYNGLGEKLSFSQNEETIYATIAKEHIRSIRKKLKFLDDRDEFSLKL